MHVLECTRLTFAFFSLTTPLSRSITTEGSSFQKLNRSIFYSKTQISIWGKLYMVQDTVLKQLLDGEKEDG